MRHVLPAPDGPMMASTSPEFMPPVKGSHSPTFQLNLSCFYHSHTDLDATQRTMHKCVTFIRRVDECQ